jgi:hypothetical protein
LLSKPKLSVLRRLAADGVVRDGLHLAVNGLTEDGFVIHDDGYMLSEKGAAVLYLYDNVTDAERSLLMRVYRAMQDNETYSAQHDTDKVAAELIHANLLYADNGNLYLCESAQEAWAGWVEFLNERQKYNEQQKRYQAKKAQEAKEMNGTALSADESIVHFLHHAHAAAVEAAVPPPLTTAAECADNCTECVHREVLDLIAATYPKVAELRDAMLTQKKLIKDLGL